MAEVIKKVIRHMFGLKNLALPILSLAVGKSKNEVMDKCNRGGLMMSLNVTERRGKNAKTVWYL